MESQIQVRKPLGFDAIIGAMSDQSVANDIILGVCTKDSSISRNPYEVCRNELALLGSYAQVHCFNQAIAFLKSRCSNFDAMVSYILSLDGLRERVVGERF
jgi:threonine dehydrogenase-like Zn-dependent dehydrogenase